MNYKDAVVDSKDITEVIVACIAAGTTWGVYLHGKRKVDAAHKTMHAERTLRQQLQDEMAARRAALSYSHLSAHWEMTRAAIETAMSTSRIDRFMMFRAFNGKYDPQTTTAVLQLRQGYPTENYIDFPLDDHYRETLGYVRRDTRRRMRHSDFPFDSEMYAVYRREGVTDSYWVYLSDYELPNGCWAIEYVSWATHHPDGFTEDDIVLCDILIGSMRKLSLTLAADLRVYEASLEASK